MQLLDVSFLVLFEGGVGSGLTRKLFCLVTSIEETLVFLVVIHDYSDWRCFCCDLLDRLSYNRRLFYCYLRLRTTSLYKGGEWPFNGRNNSLVSFCGF